MKCRILQPMKRHPSGIWPEGSVIDEPEAVILVQLGAAVPADEECEQAHGLTPEQLQSVQHSYRRTAHGIHPDDFRAFDAGEMVGYNPDGTPIPGPNAEPPESDLIFLP